VKGADLLSAVWSFLRHPASAAEDHLLALEARLETQMTERLESVRSLLVEQLRRELRRVARVLALGASVGLLALVAGFFALLGIWLSLRSVLGGARASFLIAALFAVLSLGVLRQLRG